MLKIRVLLENNRQIVLVLAVAGILVDIFLRGSASDPMIIALTTLWIVVIWIYKLRDVVLIRNGLLLIAVSPFFLMAKKIYMAEKVAIWAFIFLSLGVLRKIIVEAKRTWRKEK